MIHLLLAVTVIYFSCVLPLKTCSVYFLYMFFIDNNWSAGHLSRLGTAGRVAPPCNESCHIFIFLAKYNGAFLQSFSKPVYKTV